MNKRSKLWMLTISILTLVSCSIDDVLNDNSNSTNPTNSTGTNSSSSGRRAPFFHPLMLDERPIIASVMLILVVGMNLGVKLYFKSDDGMKEMALLEKQNLEQQLEYLKYQITPHFFMNTLNNIHALVDIDLDKAN